MIPLLDSGSIQMQQQLIKKASIYKPHWNAYDAEPEAFENRCSASLYSVIITQ